jgi:hypothetical protein
MILVVSIFLRHVLTLERMAVGGQRSTVSCGLTLECSLCKTFFMLDAYFLNAIFLMPFFISL